MTTYPRTWLRADLIAGLTTAAVVIPKAMAFATIAGLPLEAGLYTALIPSLVYAATGTSKPLSVTTTSTISILAAGALAQAGQEGGSAHLIVTAAALALMVGCALVAASVLKLGFLAGFISLPVLAGFKAGIAIVIVVDQLPKMLGIHFAKAGFLRDAVSLWQHLPDTSMATLVLAVSLLILIVGIEHVLPTFPGPLVAAGAAIAASALLGLERRGVELVGQVDTGLPSFTPPDLGLAVELWPAALGIALMSFVETIAAGRAFVRPGEALPQPNRELLALGLANVAGSGFHCMPAGGGTSQTAVNRAAGARTQMAGVVAALVALATLFFLAPVVALLPQAALAAIVVATTVGLFRPAEFAAIRRVRHTEFWWAVVAMTGVVLLGTLEGILVAVAVSVLVLIREANHPPVYVLGRRRGTSVFEAVSPTDSDVETFPGLLLMRTEGRIHFANAHRVGEQIWSLIHEGRPRVVALEMGAVPDLEYTALQALTDAEKKLQEAGMTLWLVALNRRVREVISRSPLGEVVTGDRIFPTAAHAVDAYTRLTSETSSRPSTGRPDVAGAGGVD
jgi:high affinity sulfate transporter 1